MTDCLIAELWSEIQIYLSENPSESYEIFINDRLFIESCYVFLSSIIAYPGSDDSRVPTHRKKKVSVFQELLEFQFIKIILISGRQVSG